MSAPLTSMHLPGVILTCDRPRQSSRRAFIRWSGLAAGAAPFVVRDRPSAGRSRPPTPPRSSGQLVEGNKRFVRGELAHPRRRPEDFAPLAEGQAPMAIIVGCADSRVSPELVFDQGVGDLFVVRVAGNVVSGAGPTVKGSIEFAVAELGARLIVVLGHGACGAVKAAIQHIDANDTLPGSIRDLVELIRPAAAAVRGKPGDKLENAIKANVELGVERLKGLDPILSAARQDGGAEGGRRRLRAAQRPGRVARVNTRATRRRSDVRSITIRRHGVPERCRSPARPTIRAFSRRTLDISSPWHPILFGGIGICSGCGLVYQERIAYPIPSGPMTDRPDLSTGRWSQPDMMV